jgi:hypothetical protein
VVCARALTGFIILLKIYRDANLALFSLASLLALALVLIEVDAAYRDAEMTLHALTEASIVATIVNKLFHVIHM